MLQRILYLARYDLSFLLRSRETQMWVFFMPILFMFLIGNMMPGRQRATGPAQLTLVAPAGADSVDQPVTHALVRHLEAAPFRVVLEADSSAASAWRMLFVPPDFERRAIAGIADSLRFARGGDPDAGSRLDQVRVQRAVFALLGDLAVISARGDSINAASLAALRAKPRAIALDVKLAGRSKIIPGGFQQAVPGILTQFIFLVMLTSGGVMLVIERRAGLLRRIASAPVTRGEVLASRILARFALGLVQTVFAMGVAALLFPVNWGGSLPMILVLFAALALSGATLSVLFGNLTDNPGQTVGLAVLGANLAAALGGCWWPIEIVPAFMQKIAWFLPTGWTMHGLHRLMSYGDPPEAALGSLALLLASALVFFALGVRTFRYR